MNLTSKYIAFKLKKLQFSGISLSGVSATAKHNFWTKKKKKQKNKQMNNNNNNWWQICWSFFPPDMQDEKYEAPVVS